MMLQYISFSFIFLPPSFYSLSPPTPHLQVNTNYEGINLITKFGYVHLYDKETGNCIYIKHINRKTVFVRDASSGTICVNKKGQVCWLSGTSSISIVYTNELFYVCIVIEYVNVVVLSADHCLPFSFPLIPSLLFLPFSSFFFSFFFILFSFPTFCKALSFNPVHWHQGCFKKLEEVKIRLPD